MSGAWCTIAYAMGLLAYVMSLLARCANMAEGRNCRILQHVHVYICMCTHVYKACAWLHAVWANCQRKTCYVQGSSNLGCWHAVWHVLMIKQTAIVRSYTAARRLAPMKHALLEKLALCTGAETAAARHQVLHGTHHTRRRMWPGHSIC